MYFIHPNLSFSKKEKIEFLYENKIEKNNVCKISIVFILYD